jgi:hypothetical protein
MPLVMPRCLSTKAEDVRMFEIDACQVVSFSAPHQVTLYTTIIPDRGLAEQHFRCSDCNSPIAMSTFMHVCIAPVVCVCCHSQTHALEPRAASLEARFCNYSGMYYCSKCHWDEDMVIPARIVQNWDFRPHKVRLHPRSHCQLFSPKASRCRDLPGRHCVQLGTSH